MSYSYTIKNTLGNFNDQLIKIISIVIKNDSDLFVERSIREYVTVSDGTNSVSAFFTDLTPNLKYLRASFTTDAFAIFTGNVEIKFGYGDDVLGTFSAIDINAAVLAAIPPQLVANGTFTIANNAWLASL